MWLQKRWQMSEYSVCTWISSLHFFCIFCSMQLNPVFRDSGVQYWIHEGKVFFFFFLFLFIKLPLPWNNILVVFTMLPFCSLSWLFLPEKHPFVCYFSKYLFNFMFFSSEICISFTLFTLFWVRRLLLFLLPWNYQTISKGCFCFLNLYETLPTLELFVWHCFWFYLICLKPLKCTTN